MEAAAVATWMFVDECPIPHDVMELMLPGEQPVAAYRTSFRDSTIFTTKRMTVRDAQGITGKKVEVYSPPYTAINMRSTENAGKFDLDAELELCTRAGHIKIKVGKKMDVRRLDMLLAHSVIGAQH